MGSKRLKQTFFLLVWIILPLLSFGNDQPDALFAKANGYYARAQYKEALATYQKIIAAHEHSAAVYFNMGNASYKLGDIPSALLYYEKAHQLSPNDDDINANIRLANSKTRDKIEDVPEFFLDRWWETIFLGFSANTFALSSLLSVLLGSAFLIIYFFAYRRAVKKSSFFAAITCFILSIFSIFLLSQQINYFKQRQGIVFSSPVYVKSAPAEQSRDLFLIHDGTKVMILEDHKEWLRVRLANGNEGWIKASDLKVI
jgi:tetratricopeptide (TPR) repeat protein